MGTGATVRNRGGRPCKLTTAAALRIVAAVARGKNRIEAATAAGVGASTLFRWEQRGRAGVEPFASFLDAVNAAQSAAKVVDGVAFFNAIRVLDRVRF